jgi:alpha-tubulin suppressor-like RCC1 family protein
MPSRSVVSALLLVALAPACKKTDPLYCDETTPCTDPERPFCDLNGEYPDSDGIKRTCIPDPFPDAGPGADASGPRRVVHLTAGGSHTCALLSDGAVRCWGQGTRLGYATTDNIGDNEQPYVAGDVPTGGVVKQVAAGGSFTCALYEEGNVRCWGDNNNGQLGYGDKIARAGAEYTPDKLPDLDLGGTATQLAGGSNHMCALLDTHEVRCWGQNADYQLGTGDNEDVGDDEAPASRNAVAVGASVLAISAGESHTCALIEGNHVRCWGTTLNGPIGYGSELVIGDNETPAQAGNVTVGGSVTQVAAGGDHTCAVLDTGSVRCWGSGDKTGVGPGVLGYEETEDIGDDESPASAGDVAVAGQVQQVAGGNITRCALLASGDVRCWGWIVTTEGLEDWNAVLGQGEVAPIGDDETPAEVPPIDLGGTAIELADRYGYHQCALLDTGAVRCWGFNFYGQLGLGHTESIGDDELPSAESEVRVLE